MPTTRGLERLIFFTDAVTAIAITLLILPLVDEASDAANTGGSTLGFLSAHFSQIISFLISFAVISRLWIAHHSAFEHLRSYNGRILTLSLLWAFTIVLLPLPTALAAQVDPGPAQVAFYIGTMAVSSIVLTLLMLAVRRNPALENPENPVGRRQMVGSVTTTALFLLAMVLGTLVPALNYYSLIVLVLAAPIGIWLNRREGARASS